jgi:putative endonuclease
VSSVDTNNKAQQAAAVYLEMRGYSVLERNWRRPRSKIDIIANKNGVMHFIEVNYSDLNEQSPDLEPLTSSKLLQTQRSVWGWVDENDYKGQYVISAIELLVRTSWL